MIADNLAVPFETTVLGVTVTVRKIEPTGSGIVAVCIRGKHRQAISILDLPLPDPPPRGPDDDTGLAEWIASLPAEQKDTLLARVASGEGAQVQALLLHRFRAAGGSESAASARTVAELWQAAGDRRAAREKAGEQRRHEEEARKAAARAAAYARHLDELATRTEAAWREAAALIETKRPRDSNLQTRGGDAEGPVARSQRGYPCGYCRERHRHGGIRPFQK
jgi:hypothetical protein